MISNIQLSTYPVEKRRWITNERRLLGDTIRRARMDNKMTQEQLAEAINISPTHMKHIESEHRKPSVEVLFLLADVLNFSMDAMLMEKQSDGCEARTAGEDNCCSVAGYHWGRGPAHRSSAWHPERPFQGSLRCH